jgi:N-acetylglucosamine kinase-like BadF-type ATPase
MSLFIGIDGGGSKTKCVLCNDSFKVIFETQSGPSNFLTIGTETVSETILSLLADCCSSQNISISQLKGIVLGTTGAGRENDARNLEKAVNSKALSKNLILNSFKVVSDARIALEGAFSSQPGSILIAGTGSIMFGKDKDDNIHRVGGFGRLIGDEGSGLTLGRKGLNVLSKYFDERGKKTLLKEKIEKQFGIVDQSQLISKVYNNELKIQHVAPLVLEAAAEGDELCINILDEETNELLLHIVAMTKKLKEESMKLVFIGGTITNENSYSKMLKEKIKLFLPQIIIQQPDYPPEIGAVIMAKQNL